MAWLTDSANSAAATGERKAKLAKFKASFPPCPAAERGCVGACGRAVASGSGAHPGLIAPGAAAPTPPVLTAQSRPTPRAWLPSGAGPLQDLLMQQKRVEHAKSTACATIEKSFDESTRLLDREKSDYISGVYQRRDEKAERCVLANTAAR